MNLSIHERKILELLAAQLLPVTGKEIIERSSGTIGRAGLYGQLSALEEAGLVRSETVYATVWGRIALPTLLYCISERGRRLHQGVA